MSHFSKRNMEMTCIMGHSFSTSTMNPQYIVVRDAARKPIAHSCIPCNNIVKELARLGHHGDRLDEMGRAICTESRKTPSGKAKTFMNSLKDIGKLFPEELPLLAAKGDRYYAWAQDMLEGKKAARELTGAAKCADAIRKEIKEKYKGVKCRVVSSNFSMGNSVTVYVIGGNPDTADRISRDVSKYQQGHFDGMTDMYEYTNHRTDIPQAKWVSVQTRDN